MTIQPGAMLYTQAFGSRPEGVEVPVIQTRDPTSFDSNYPVGKHWVNTVDNTEFCLTSQTFSAAVLSSTWTALGAAGGPINSLTTDDATVVLPTAGTIDISGANDQIVTSGSNTPGVVLLSLSSTLVVPGTLEVTGLFTTDAGANLNTGGIHALNVGTDNHTDAVNIATVGARVTTIGNVLGASAVDINVGTGNFVLDGAVTSTMAVGPSLTTGTITIGGTAAASASAITLGSSSATSTVIIQGGAGASTTLIGGGTGAANVTSINTSATAQSSTINLMTGAMTAGTHAVNILSGNSSGGTETFNVSTGTGAATLNIGTGATGVKTIAIGGTAANVITLGSTQTGGSITIGHAMTTGTITIGGTGQSTGAITLGSSTAANSVLIQNGVNVGAQITSINSGANGADSTVNILNGVATTGAGALNIFSSTAAATSQTLNLFNGINTNGTNTINIGTSTGTLVTANILTGAVAHVLNVGSSSAGNITVTSSGTIAVIGTTNINATGSAVSTIGTGGTGAVHIGNATGNTAVTGSLTASTTLTATSGAITATSGDFVATNGNLQLQTVGNKIEIKAGTTGFCGTGTLSSGVLQINNTNIATGDIILLTRIAANGSTTFGVLSYTISNGASFTVTSLILGTPGSTQTADTSTFAYVIIRPL